MILEFGVVVGVIIGVAEVFKRAFGLNGRYVPLLTLILGVIAYVFLGAGNMFMAERIFTGIIAGLSSVGLFSGIKNTVE